MWGRMWFLPQRSFHLLIIFLPPLLADSYVSDGIGESLRTGYSSQFKNFRIEKTLANVFNFLNILQFVINWGRPPDWKALVLVRPVRLLNFSTRLSARSPCSSRLSLSPPGMGGWVFKIMKRILFHFLFRAGYQTYFDYLFLHQKCPFTCKIRLFGSSQNL